MLEIRGLSVCFPLLSRKVQAVADVDLTLDHGEILGLVGESGCGKSVASSACLGLVTVPGQVQGSICVGSKEIIGRPAKDLERIRGEQIAMIFQNPMAALNPFFTVGHQLCDIICRHQGHNRKIARRIATNLFDQVRLPDPDRLLNKYPHQLSGGQLQRVMIAMALSCRPQVLIADEPTTALDVTVQAQILALLADLVTDTGMAVLFITHDLGVVSALCHRVAVMYAGRIVEQGEVRRVFNDPKHPYTEGLLHTVPELGTGRGRLRAIPGTVPDLAACPKGCAFHPRCPRSKDLCTRQIPKVVVSTTAEARAVACHFPLSSGSGK